MMILPHTPVTGMYYARIGKWEVISTSREMVIREGLNLFFTGAFEGPDNSKDYEQLVILKNGAHYYG